jgi:hypothetical protein
MDEEAEVRNSFLPCGVQTSSGSIFKILFYGKYEAFSGW